MAFSRLLFVISQVLLAWSQGNTKSQKELNILVMAPSSNFLNDIDLSWNIGPAVIPAARLAVDQINQRSDLLQGYTLKLLGRESGCTLTSKTLINFVEAEFYNVADDRGVIGMIGPGCSESVLATANLSRTNLNFMQVSISFSPEINGPNYINSFRTVPSASVYVDAFIRLMEAADWRKVVVAYDTQDSSYSSVFSVLKKRIGSRRMYPIELRPAPDGHDHTAEFFKEVDRNNARVILTLVGMQMAQNILCQKYKLRSHYVDFQFIFMDVAQEDIFNLKLFPKDNTFYCTSEDLEEALNTTIFLTNRYRRADEISSNTFAGISYQSYEKLYDSYLDKYLKEKQLDKNCLPSSSVRYFNAYYDAVWALSIALNDSTADFDLTDYAYGKLNYDIAQIGDRVRNSLEVIQFEGMSGLIHFNKTTRDTAGLGVVLNQTILRRTGRKWEHHTGTFVNGSLKLNENFDFLPYTLKTIHHHADRAVGFTVLILGLFAVFCFIGLQITFLFLDMAEVKASSPQLSYLILSGCCFYLAALIIFTVQEVFPTKIAHHPLISGILCNLQTWCFSFAFTLIFGTICAKTWRIYRIFTHFKQGRVKYVSDEFLVSFIICLLLIDLVYLIAWTFTNPWSWDSHIKREGTVLVTYHRCVCNNFKYWSIVLLLQKLILMFLAILLSIMVQPVKKKGFKNTKAILILIYSLIIIHVVGISIYVLLDILQKLHILRFLGYTLIFALSLIIVTLSLFLTHIWPNLKRRKIRSSKGHELINHQNTYHIMTKPYETTTNSTLLSYV